MLTMTTIDFSSDPQLLSLGPEGVKPSKPRVRRQSGEPWGPSRPRSPNLVRVALDPPGTG